MGPIEKLLRKTNVRRHASVVAAYSVPEAGKVLVGARRNLGLSVHDNEMFLRSLPDIFSEAIEAASALRI